MHETWDEFLAFQERARTPVVVDPAALWTFQRPAERPQINYLLALAAPFILAFSIAWGAAETYAPRWAARVEAHAQKFLIFGSIGAFVFLSGLVLQWAVITHTRAGPLGSYAAQAVFSVELSFVLNRVLTWRDRDIALGLALLRWNVQKLAMTVLNLLGYALLIFLGVNWLVANVLVTAVFTVINYVGGHAWSFAPRKHGVHRRDAVPPVLLEGYAPTVSAVIPCKNNEDSIAATVVSLLDQTYPLAEVIVVGDVDDSTYVPLWDIPDPRLIILEEAPSIGREPNVKRDSGVRKASGEVIALVDSDIVMDKDWMLRALALLAEQGGGLVAGGMVSIEDSFIGRFVDGTSLGAKTPRVPEPYSVTTANFGQRGRKPPIAANLVFTRELYDQCPLDIYWAQGYEDYEWLWRVVLDGHKVYYDDALTGRHRHKRTFKALGREYLRAGRGCARFVHAHPEAPLARKRMRQARLIPLAALAGLALVCSAFMAGHGREILFGSAVVTAGLSGWEARKSRMLQGLAYPFLSLTLAALFTFSLARHVLPKPRAEWVPDDSETTPLQIVPTPSPVSQVLKRRCLLIIGAALTGAVLLRVIFLATQPDWQVDEVTYTTIAKNLLYLHKLSLPPAWGQPWKPFLFHPPFYFWLLRSWFWLTGASIYHARILGVICAAIMFVLLSRFIWKEYGPVAAVAVLLFVATDGWLLYVQRVSYMENALMVLVVATLLAYQKASETGAWRWFIAAGALAGCTAIFKHTGAYIIVTLAVAWLLTRRRLLRHLAMLGISVLICVVYVWYMIHTDGLQAPLTKPLVLAWGHNNYYVHQTLVQLRRTLGAQKNGGGGLTSVGQFFHLLLSPQYVMFVPSFLVVVTSLFLLGRTFYRCWRIRSMEPLGGHVILPAWTVTGVVLFSASALKFSQYFILFLLPLYCYLWTYAAEHLGRQSIRRSTLVAGATAVMLLGLLSFQIRVHISPGNVLKEAIAYIRSNVPRGDLVIAATPVAYALPPQPWCTQRDPNITAACLNNADYIVTWQTYLQPVNPEGNPGFARLLQHSVVFKTIHGFNGQIQIWRVRR